MPLRPPIKSAGKSEKSAEIEVDADADDPQSKFALRHLFWKAAVWSLIGVGFQTFAGIMPSYVESIYSEGIYYYIQRGLSFINNFIPFSIGEIFFLGLGFYFFSWLLWYMRRVFRQESRLWDVTKLFWLQMFWTFSVLFVLFLLLWGLNFQRREISEAAKLERPPVRTDELQVVGARIVNLINNSYNSFETAVSDQNNTGASRLPYTDLVLLKNLENAFQKTGMLGTAGQSGVANPKPLILSSVASMLGIDGIYMPFTGEATYNKQLPANILPFVLAHQKAHQRGYAREDEANFVAYVVCTNAEDPYIRYSGHLHSVKVLKVLEQSNIERYTESLGAGPSADLGERVKFWEQAKNPTFADLVNQGLGAYLRVNRVPRGNKSSDDDIPLIINYLIKNRPPGDVPPQQPAP
jgi:Protein of unknown function (DUF3810)